MQWILLFLSRKSAKIFEFKIAPLLEKNATAISDCKSPRTNQSEKHSVTLFEIKRL